MGDKNMYEDNALYELMQYIQQEYGATCTTVWFWNCDRHPLLLIKLPNSRYLIAINLEELKEYYERLGWESLCEITDNTIRMLKRRMGLD